MATSQIIKDFSGHRDRTHKFKYKEKGGARNVCSAPCSSCFHVCKAPPNSTDECTGETCSNNVVVDRGKQLETGNLSEMSTLPGMHSNSDSLSENAVGKVSLRTSDAYASDDNVAHSKFEGRKVPEGQNDCFSCAGGAHEHANRELLNKEVALDVFVEPPAMPQKSVKENDDMEVEIEPSEETDDSEMVEQDVKVCDICGDAGREELLAVCFQCSDGAEHTYCMREMLEEVPEGDWLCEECRFAEQVTNEKQEKIDGYEKNSSSGQASGEHVNNSDVEEQRAKGNMKIPGKRLRDDADAEVSSIVKKPASESVVKSPKTSISSRIATLSREYSLRNPDKNGLVNSTTESTNIASDLRGNDFRGTFSKSNSFNSLNSKPKVKLVDQVVLQRQKSARVHSSFRLKEGLGRSIGKSMSFKSLNSGLSESKSDTFSPRVSRVHDSKVTKQRSSFERQSSFRNEHPSTKPVMGTSRLEKKPVRSSSNLGDFKKPSLHGRTNGDNTEEKHNQISPRDDFSSQKAHFNANEGLPDGLSRPRDSSNAGGRASGGRFRAPGAKYSVGENDKLKAAIEAAVLRKPELYRKHWPLGQSDDSSTSHEERVSKFVVKKQFSLPEELPERQTVSKNSQSDSIRRVSVDNVKRFSLVPVEGLSSVGGDSVLPLDGKYLLKDMWSNVPAAMPLFLKLSAIPEQEYIWRGSFEICRSGNVVELWDGLQAHLSTLASPNVNEAVNKCNSKIVLHEEPRLSTWPVQFQENGVREDNIAFFIFAKDLESYDKIYKVMLDNMMKNDLALKGNINGVELLIFPSNHLPDKAQRWNMFFFLWAVFRVKKESCLQPMPESAKQVSAHSDIPPAIMSVSESKCSLRPIVKDLPVTDDTASVQKVLAAEKLRNLLSYRTVNGDCDAKLPSLDRSGSKLNSSSSASVQSDDGKQCQEPREPFLEGSICSRNESHLQTMGSAGDSGRDEMLMHLDTPVDRQQSSHPFNECAAATTDMSPGERIRESSQNTLEIQTSNQDELQFRSNGDALSPNKETPLIENRDIIDLNLACVEPQSPSPRTCQVFAGDDDASNELCVAFKKMENKRDEACDKMDIFKYKENGERHPLPIESQSLVDGWKTNPVEQDRPHDRAPSLELALGAESTSLNQGILPLLLGKMDKKVNDERAPDEVGTTEDDDVSSSLSLSLSCPFPDKEQSTKPGVSGRQRVNNSMLLFGSLRDNECRE